MAASETVLEFIWAIERKDYDAAVAFAADDISYENMPIDPVVGRDALAAMLHSYLDPVEEVEWQILHQVEADGVVVNERLDRFRVGDRWMELPVAGFFELDEAGRIVLWRDYFDMATFQQGLAELFPS